jgi:Protein of unknown function (DUF4239)
LKVRRPVLVQGNPQNPKAGVAIPAFVGGLNGPYDAKRPEDETEMSWVFGISIYLALPLFAAAFAAVAILAHSLARRILPPPERLSEHHEVAGFLMGVVGVLYSVVLGFLVGTVWTAFASAQQTTDLEAGYVADAFNFAGQLPMPGRGSLQRLIARYAIVVRNADWSSPHQRGADRSGELLGSAVRITASLPANTIRDSLLESIRSIGDTRRLRLVQAASRLPAGLLEALLLGAVFVVTFTFFFGVRSYIKQMTMTALLAGSIGLFFGLIVELSTPYSGAIQVSRAAWALVIANNHLEDFSR